MNPAEEYILAKSEPYRSILIELRTLILQTIPEVEEKFKWHLPFYDLKGKMFCYLNFRKTFVDLSLVYATNLTEFQSILVAGEGRKMVRSLRFKTLQELDYALVEQVLLAQKSNILNK